MLPRVKITYANGALGQVVPLADGCLGFLALGAKEVTGDKAFKLSQYYVLKKLKDLEDLGVDTENNTNLYRNVKDFYAEAGDGTELWIMGFPEASTFTTILDKDTVAGAKSLLLASNGKIRMLVAFKTPASGYALKATKAIDEDAVTAMVKAQGLGDWSANELYAPILILIEGYGYTGEPTVLQDLTESAYNRVGIVIGDTSTESKNACMGVVAGRLSKVPVQRKISRVKDGALTPLTIYVGDSLAEVADVETIDEKGYITFRTFVGKTGYFIAGDHLATSVDDDYNNISNRRVVDKAYRIAYDTFISNLNDEVPIATDGSLSPSWCAAIEDKAEQAIISSMTAEGNLGNDPGDPSDTGVDCSVPYKQNVLSTSKIYAALRIKPNGYAKYIDVELGFKTK